MKHHELSPSSFGRFDRCPGSVALGAHAPSVPAGAGAERGTRIHAAALLNEGYDQLDDFDRRFADQYRAFVQEGHRAIADVHGDLVERLTEERLVIYGTGNQFVTFGTADEIHVYQDRVMIYDLKTHPTGELPEHLTTCQGIVYAVGALQRWTGTDRVTFIAYAPAGDSEFVFELHRADLAQYEEWITRTAQNVRDAHDVPTKQELFDLLNPGTEQCKFCPAASICPKIQEIAMEVAEVKDTAGIPGVVQADGELQVVDHQEFAQFYAKIELAGRAVDAAKRGMKELLHGIESEYLELKTRKGRVTFTDVPKNKSALPGGVSRTISPDDFQQAITVSVSKLRKQGNRSEP